MKTRSILLGLLVICLYSCNQYLVPDDFPLQEFYSYAPYQEGQFVKFDTGLDTIEYKVAMVEESYYRGNKHCKCGKESVDKIVRLESEIDTLLLWLQSIDRAVFEVTFESNHLYTLNAKYRVDYTNEDIWAKSYDETKIFREFSEEITLLQYDEPAAMLKKNMGIKWYVMPDGLKYTLIK